MPNTYTQLYIQLVFAVKGKGSFIFEKNRIELEKYICGIINNNKSKPLAIYCNPDHLHVLIGFHPTISVSDMTRDVKTNSSKFINEKKWVAGKFQWQDGFGAFTYAKSQIDAVSKYILNQPEHHKKKTFKDEYLLMLQKFDVKYNEKYLFDWNED
ncbi:MAG TPA: IS200/IS605 family transposase [Bacteroidia bacterium]|jgi:putative transposase|nr:IS200/IS605 family transposase [Bacteroidia bacterium]